MDPIDAASVSDSIYQDEHGNPNYSSPGPHSGSYDARLSGHGITGGNAGTFTSATVTLPATVSTPVFVTYFLEMATLESKPEALANCTLQVVNGAGHVLQVLKTHTNMDVDHLTYLPETFEITSLNQGSTVVAVQALWSDPDGLTEFRLDDVQIQSGSPSTVNPLLSAVVPSHGAPAASVTLTGGPFTGATGVVFGRSNATSFTVVSATEIQAVVPWDGATGPITVTTPNGTISSGAPFYVAPSFISNTSCYGYKFGTFPEMTPTSGAVNASIQLLGLNFTGATAVTFGGVAATNFTVNSNTLITAGVPAGAVTGPIAVTAPGGTATTLGTFTVLPGSVGVTVIPASATAGTQVTLNGTGFTGATAVTFGGVSAAPFTILSNTTINVVVPSGARSGSVTVVTPTGSISSALSFAVLPPSLTAVAAGAVGNPVTLTGSGFLDATKVTFNGTVVAAFAAPISNTQMTVTVPALSASGSYPVLVTSPEGVSAAVACAVTVPPVPATTAFTPTYGKLGSTVTINGHFLTGTTGVTLNGVAAPFTFVSDSQITFTVPVTASSGLVTVTTPSGTWTSATPFAVTIQVAINQAPDDLMEGSPFGFTATVSGDPSNSVTWSIQEGLLGGLVTTGGIYTAPATPGTYHVVATSVLDSSAAAVVAVPVNSAAVTPGAATPGQPTTLNLAYFMSAYGSKVGDASYNAFADLNGDGVINDLDLALFLSAF